MTPSLRLRGNGSNSRELPCPASVFRTCRRSPIGSFKMRIPSHVVLAAELPIGATLRPVLGIAQALHPICRGSPCSFGVANKPAGAYRDFDVPRGGDTPRATRGRGAAPLQPPGD